METRAGLPEHPSDRLRTRRFAAATGLLSAALALGSYAYYAPFLSDDALISLRYAERLVMGEGLTWNDGYYVEGYSNLAWVLAAAGLISAGLDPILALRALGGVATLAVLAVYGRAALRAAGADPVNHALVIAVFGIQIAPIWALGGLEQPLLLLCLFAAGLCVTRRPEPRRCDLAVASVFLAVAALTRPDGALFATVFGGAAFCAGGATLKTRIRAAALVVALPALAVLGHLAFRIVYYEAWVPNSARIKLGFSGERLLQGGQYLAEGVVVLLPLLVFVGWTALRRPRGASWGTTALAAAALVWMAYVVAIGGDIFPGYRHMTPVYALGLVLSLEAMRIRTETQPSQGALLPPATLMAGAVVFSLAQYAVPDNARAKSERWEWACRDLANALVDRFGAEEPTIAVTAAGCLPYWTRFEAIDLLGLNDLELPNRPPPDRGAGPLAHEFGDLGYLLERAPEIVVFNVGTPPAYVYERQIAESDAFDQRYCERVLGEDWRIYLRRSFARRLEIDACAPPGQSAGTETTRP